MLSLPSAAEPLIMSFSIAFTQPTFQRILPLLVGAILTVGRHTVTAVLRTVGPLAPGHFSSYHRVFSRAAWTLWPLGKVLTTTILRWLPVKDPVLVVVDDTTAQHRGKHMYGKGCHRDAVRSAHQHVVFRWGHRWVVLAISVKFPSMETLVNIRAPTVRPLPPRTLWSSFHSCPVVPAHTIRVGPAAP